MQCSTPVVAATGVSCTLTSCRQSVGEFQTTKDTKYASAETSAREWAEVTAKANMHKGKWSEYWEEAKAAGDLGNQKVCCPLPIAVVTPHAEHDLCISET